MTEQPYSNREMDKFLQSLQQQLDRIEEQVVKTNGRTTRNERDVSNVQTKLSTAIWAFSITLPLIMGLVAWGFFLEIDRVKSAISDEVTKELQSYQFELVK